MSSSGKDPSYGSMKRLYRSYFRACRRNNVFWGVAIEDFHRLTSEPCHYCRKPPIQISRQYLYNGLDRLIPARGYDMDNIVPCCKECNFIKGNRLTHDEMKVVGEALAKFRQRRS